jgi:Ca2+-binding RTX toxin-like protein
MHIEGGSGDDWIFQSGGAGNDKMGVLASDGNDYIYVSGGPGDDTLTVDGGRGNDLIHIQVGDGNDTVTCDGREDNDTATIVVTTPNFTILDGYTAQVLFQRGTGGSRITVNNVECLKVFGPNGAVFVQGCQ